MSYTMPAPEVQSSVTGKVPAGIYTVRAVKVVERTDKAPKGYMRTIISCEIIAPDIAVDEQSPDKTHYSVAGRKFRLYLPIDPVSKQYSQAYTAFSNLGYKSSDGSINLEKFWDDCEAGALCFAVQLSSKEKVVKNPDGTPWINPTTGQGMSQGWDIDFVQPEAILTRLNAAVPGANSGLPY